MAKMSEELKVLYNEWWDNIRKEIDRIKMDTNEKVKDILVLRDTIRKNEREMETIKGQLQNFVSDMIEIADKACSVRDYAHSIADVLDEIEDYVSDDEDEDDDEDEEPVAYCEACGAEIWDDCDIVEGDYGEYCCEECREEAEEEDEEESEDEDED